MSAIADTPVRVCSLGHGMHQGRYDTCHEMLTQRNPFCHHVNTKKGTLSQQFVTHVVPPLGMHGMWSGNGCHVNKLLIPLLSLVSAHFLVEITSSPPRND
jgi:hypothetical protein